MNEKELQKLANFTKTCKDIFENEISKLPYFDSDNYIKNSKTLKRTIATDEKIINNVPAFYLSINNSIVFQPQDFYLFTDEELLQLILHEHIHMASTDLDKVTIGFESKGFSVTYNEGLTQWLTLKLLYDDMESAIEKNIFYPQTVKEIDKLVKTIGEEKVFNGFFSANLKQNLSDLNTNDFDNVIDCMNKISESVEHNVTMANILEFKNRVESYKENQR